MELRMARRRMPCSSGTAPDFSWALRAARLNSVSLENSPDHPLGSVAPESPVEPAPENPWGVRPSEAVPASNGAASDHASASGIAASVNGDGVAGSPELVEPASLTETPATQAEALEDGAARGWVPAVEAATGAPLEMEMVRSTLSEWVITVLLLLFLTSFLVQAFVIPTGSMEDTLLIGDHLLVDKLAFAPPGPASKYLLPYTPVKRGDIIVFRYPTDIQQTFV